MRRKGSRQGCGQGQSDRRVATGVGDEAKSPQKGSEPTKLLYRGGKYRHAQLPCVALYRRPRPELSEGKGAHTRLSKPHSVTEEEGQEVAPLASEQPQSLEKRAKRADSRMQSLVVAHRSWLEDLHAAQRGVESLRQQITLELAAKRQALMAEVEQRYHEAAARADATLDFHLAQLLQTQRRVKSSATAVSAVSNRLHAAMCARREMNVSGSEAGEANEGLEALTAEAEAVASAAAGVSVDEVVAVPRVATDVPAARDFCRFCVRHRIRHRSRSAGRREDQASVTPSTHSSHRRSSSRNECRAGELGAAPVLSQRNSENSHNGKEKKREVEGLPTSSHRSCHQSVGDVEQIGAGMEKLLTSSHRSCHQSVGDVEQIGANRVEKVPLSSHQNDHQISGHGNGAGAELREAPMVSHRSDRYHAEVGEGTGGQVVDFSMSFHRSTHHSIGQGKETGKEVQEVVVPSYPSDPHSGGHGKEAGEEAQELLTSSHPSSHHSIGQVGRAPGEVEQLPEPSYGSTPPSIGQRGEKVAQTLPSSHQSSDDLVGERRGAKWEEENMHMVPYEHHSIENSERRREELQELLVWAHTAGRQSMRLRGEIGGELVVKELLTSSDRVDHHYMGRSKGTGKGASIPSHHPGSDHSAAQEGGTGGELEELPVSSHGNDHNSAARVNEARGDVVVSSHRSSHQFIGQRKDPERRLQEEVVSSHGSEHRSMDQSRWAGGEAEQGRMPSNTSDRHAGQAGADGRGERQDVFLSGQPGGKSSGSHGAGGGGDQQEVLSPTHHYTQYRAGGCDGDGKGQQQATPLYLQQSPSHAVSDAEGNGGGLQELEHRAIRNGKASAWEEEEVSPPTQRIIDNVTSDGGVEGAERQTALSQPMLSSHQTTIEERLRLLSSHEQSIHRRSVPEDEGGVSQLPASSHPSTDEVCEGKELQETPPSTDLSVSHVDRHEAGGGAEAAVAREEIQDMARLSAFAGDPVVGMPTKKEDLAEKAIGALVSPSATSSQHTDFKASYDVGGEVPPSGLHAATLEAVEGGPSDPMANRPRAIHPTTFAQSESFLPSFPPSDVDAASSAPSTSFEVPFGSDTRLGERQAGDLALAAVEGRQQQESKAAEEPLPKIEWAPRPASQALEDLRQLYDWLHSPGQLLHSPGPTEEKQAPPHS